MATKRSTATNKPTIRSTERDTKTTGNNTEPETEVEVNGLLESLSDESQTLVKIISLIVTNKFKTEMDTLKNQLFCKNQKIQELHDEISKLNEEVQDLECNIDSVDQYERRDTILISGAVPEETTHENPTAIMTHIIKTN